MYEINDYVVYGFLKICKVDGIETPPFEHNENKKYYKLHPVYDNKNDTTVYVPLDASGSLHSLFSKEEAEKALREFPKLTPLACSFKKPPQQLVYYQEILSSYDLNKYLALLKGLIEKERTATKRLSEVELRYQNKLERLLCEEFSLLFSETPEQSKERIFKSLK